MSISELKPLGPDRIHARSPRGSTATAELGVIANMQPLWAQLDDLMTVLAVPRLDEDRAAGQYRMRSILDGGGQLTFGSDWPCTSGTPVEGLAISTSRPTVS